MKANWFSVANRKADDELDFEITANAFLYHMVRRLVQVHINVGQGFLDIEDLKHHLLKPRSEPFQGLAPPQGLSLVKVSYPVGEDENILKKASG
jgi:tRNA pseudouridine38-40 synthase